MILQSIHTLIEILEADSSRIHLIWGVCRGKREELELKSFYKEGSREWVVYRETIGRKICSMERRENRKEQLSLLTVEEEEGLPPLLWLESPDLKHRDILFVAIPLALGNMKNFLNHFLWFESVMMKASGISCLTDRNGRIFRISRRGCELLDISMEEAEGAELDDFLVSPSDIGSLEKLCRHSEGIEIYLKTKKGREVLCIGSAASFKDKREDVLYYYFSALDISQQMSLFSHSVRDNIELADRNEVLLRSQTTLLKTEKLASIGLLGSGLAHEINNPLSFIVNDISLLSEYMENIIGFIDGAMEAVEEGRDRERLNELYKRHDIKYCAKEVPEMLEEMRDGVDRIANLVRSLKSFSGVDKSGEWGYFNLNKTLEEMLLISRNEYKYDIDVNFHDGEIPLVYCTVKEINQAFLALFMNGIQAVRESLSDGERGLITIETQPADRNTVEVVFSDSGVPFSEEDLDRLTDPFYSGWEKGEHSGMGLAVVNDIIAFKHKGNVKIEGGDGKRIILSLPVYDPLPEESL